jgi:hypothetical protein
LRGVTTEGRDDAAISQQTEETSRRKNLENLSRCSPTPVGEQWRSPLLALEVIVQVSPLRIHGIDEVFLSSSRTCLELFLPCYRTRNVVASLIIDQPDSVVPVGESTYKMLAVLVYAPLQITGHTGVKHTVGPVRHHVNVTLAHGAILCSSPDIGNHESTRDCHTSAAFGR